MHSRSAVKCATSTDVEYQQSIFQQTDEHESIMNTIIGMSSATNKRKRNEDEAICTKEGGPLYTIRVYVGGEIGTHVQSWKDAAHDLKLKERGVTVEYKSLKDVRHHIAHRLEPYWDHPRQLIDWLLGGDVHIIQSQNLYLGFYGLWDIHDCLQDCQRLIHHPGFPRGKQIQCPVLQSNKFLYLTALARTNDALPTLCVPLEAMQHQPSRSMPFVPNAAYHQLIKQCSSFMADPDNDVDGQKFFLKGTFLEHQVGFRSLPIPTVAVLEQKIQATRLPSKAFNKKGLATADVFSHLLLQPKVSNNEEKIILFNGKAKFNNKSDSTAGLTNKVSQHELNRFAEEVVQKLKVSFPHFLWEALIRVDIFRTKEGKLVVNEVESLDANCSSPKNERTMSVFQFYRKFWRFIIRDSIRRAKKLKEKGAIDYDEEMNEFSYDGSDAVSIVNSSGNFL